MFNFRARLMLAAILGLLLVGSAFKVNAKEVKSARHLVTQKDGGHEDKDDDDDDDKDEAKSGKSEKDDDDGDDDEDDGDGDHNHEHKGANDKGSESDED